MKNVNEILNIKTATLLFSGNKNTIEKEYRDLCKQWHPDINKDKKATNVFIHIAELYNQALEFFRLGTWEVPGIIKIKDKFNGTVYKINYRKHHSFELGDMYIGNNVIAYLIHNKYLKYFHNMVIKLKKIKYKDDKLQQEFFKLMPNFNISFDTCDNRTGIIIKKSKDLLLLKDVLSYYNNKLDPKHVAWIVNCLYNLSCFFSLNNLVHNNISLDTCFLSPVYHEVRILGGWWYSTYATQPMIGIPKRTYNLMPPNIKSAKLGNTTTDLELIKDLGRTLLGDSTGMKLNKMYPKLTELVTFYRVPSKGVSVQDYVDHDKILLKIFGPKKFIKLDLNADQLYR